jgi:hypothetical protein
MLKEADGVESSEESAVGSDVVESGGEGGGDGGHEMKKNRGAKTELRKEGGEGGGGGWGVKDDGMRVEGGLASRVPASPVGEMGGGGGGGKYIY